MAAQSAPSADASGLPAEVAAAWGVRERSHKGPKPALTLAKIVDAAVHIADTEGLDAVSMSRVATALGAAPMSLYRHVASKEELRRLMVDAAWGDSPGPLAPGETWRDVREPRADTEALAWLTQQAGVDKSSDTNVRQLSDPTSAVNLNMGTLVGSYASVARMLDEIDTVPGAEGVLLTFDDFVKGVEAFGTRIQPLMRSRRHLAKLQEAV